MGTVGDVNKNFQVVIQKRQQLTKVWLYESVLRKIENSHYRVSEEERKKRNSKKA